MQKFRRKKIGVKNIPLSTVCYANVPYVGIYPVLDLAKIEPYRVSRRGYTAFATVGQPILGHLLDETHVMADAVTY